MSADKQLLRVQPSTMHIIVCIKCYSRSVRETLKLFLVCSETMCQCVIACLTPQCATLSLNKHFICTCLTSDKCELSSSDKCELSSSFKCFSRSVRNASHAVSEILKFFLVCSETMSTPSCGFTAYLMLSATIKHPEFPCTEPAQS